MQGFIPPKVPTTTERKALDTIRARHDLGEIVATAVWTVMSRSLKNVPEIMASPQQLTAANEILKHHKLTPV